MGDLLDPTSRDAAPPTPPPMSDATGPNGGSDLLAGVAAPPAAGSSSGGPKPAAHGGIGGFLRDVVSFVNPLNTGKLVANIAGAGLTDLHNAGDMAMGHINELAHGDPLNSDLPQHLRPQQGEDFLHFFGRQAPLTGGIATTAQRTGADVAGGVQGAMGGALGQGFQHAAAQRYRTKPFGEILGNVGTAALLAGPIAGGLGAAGDAAGSGAASADTLASEAEAHAASVANAAARGVASPTAAAETAQEAAGLRALADARAAGLGAQTGSALKGLAGGVSKVGEVAGKALGAPFAPYRAAIVGDLAPVVGERVASMLPNEGRFNGVRQGLHGITDIGGAKTAEDRAAAVAQHPVIEPLANMPIPHTANGPATLGEALANRATDKAFREFARNTIENPTRQEQASIARNLADTRATLADRGGLFGRKVTPDPAAEQALNLRQVGAAPGLKALLDVRDQLAASHPEAVPVIDWVLTEQGLTPEVAQAVAGVGGKEAVLRAAEQMRGPQIANRSADYFAGRGMGYVPAPENPVTHLLEDKVDVATADARLAAHNANQDLAVARATAGVPSGPRPEGGVPADQANLPALTLAAKQLASGESMGPKAYGALGDLAAEHGLQSPEQIPNYVAHARAELGLSNPGLVHGAEQAATAANQAADESFRRAIADPMNAQARWRPAAQLGHRLQDGMKTAAAEADRVAPGSGDLIRQGAETMPTTLRALVDAGVNPAHLIGPGEAPESPLLARNNPALPRVTKLAAQNLKEAGAIPGDLGDVARTDLRNAAKVIANESAPALQARFGTTAAAEGLAAGGGSLREAIQAAGLHPWNPKAWTETVPWDQVNSNTPLIPQRLFDQFRTYFKPAEIGTAGSIWDSLIRGGKNLTVALNPAYHAAVVLGDTLKASALGGVNPVELGRQMIEAAKLLKNEPDHPLVVELANRGLSAEQSDQLLGREAPKPGITGRLAAPGWKASGWMQSVQRIGLALAKEADGVPRPEAVADATRVMGDFTNLTPVEQNAFRRIVPGYAFYKAITKMALELPVEAPERIGWLNYLSNAAGSQKRNEPGFLDPMRVFGTIPSLALPIRAAAEAAGFKIGTDIRKNRMLTEPALVAPDGKPVPKGSPLLRGPAALKEGAYLGSQLLPQGKAIDALLMRNVKRYDTGEPVRDKTSSAPGHEVPYPGGRLGALEYALQLNTPPATPVAPSAKSVKYAKSQVSAARNYRRLGSFGRK